ncbi:alkanesulfonate monooxygenase [Humibacillus xanthopallidus]|uniref:Alkanesulfonate monooxygenase n=1 Tax=Humibacillus xanthopallidus TaxID=412689 RepID=A0A543PR64_9MICO|nr:LLM class flavin-dependent oxidoreductase [Humibacillus xanthopallidus]TQN46567.1 alkanesulfonate monooxygenase [Humibacillus xanthopallidus]
MSRTGVTLHWFLPTAGDSRHLLGSFHAAPSRVTGSLGYCAPTLDYLGQVARAADDLGFTGVLTPTGTWCEDAWLTSAALAAQTSRLKFLVAFRPGLISPTLAAQMAATLQRQTGGRLLINIVTGGDDLEMRRFGDWLDHDERYARTEEFVRVLRGAWGTGPFDLDGDHIHVVGATTAGSPDPVPGIYFGGSSDPAIGVAARTADVYLTWGEPPDLARAKVDRVRAAAAAVGRELRYGIRLHVISRGTSEEAWAVADRLLAQLNPEVIAAAQQQLSASGSIGQQRMVALHGGRTDQLEIAPNLWAGVGLVRGGAGTALVGSHAEVADRIADYHRDGFDEFILSGYPHLEEAYHVAEGVMPALRQRGLLNEP